MILDNDVLIDLLRGLPLARAWLNVYHNTQYIRRGRPEALCGARNASDLRWGKYLQAFTMDFLPERIVYVW